MTIRRSVLGAALLLVCSACTREIASQDPAVSSALDSTGPTTTAAVTTTESPTTPAPTTTTLLATEPPTTPAPTTAAPTTVPVPTDVTGVVVAGSAGGVGPDATDGFSEAVRNEDGTCSGWTGRGVPTPWTEGLESGASFFILPRDGHDVLAEGALGTSSAANVGTDTEQWLCSFPFTFTITGVPDEFMIKIANLDPWLMRRDPTDETRFIGSTNTVAAAEYFPECVGAGTTPITAWDSVGLYWSVGIPALCRSGLRVRNIERPCRGGHEGSDYIVKVVNADDPDIVYEDAGGLEVDPATIAPGTEAVVLVATGRPCG